MSTHTLNTHSANILIAEDDSSTRKTLSVILEDEGHLVFACEDGEEALKRIAALESRLREQHPVSREGGIRAAAS